MVELQSLNDVVAQEAKNLGADDFVVLSFRTKEDIVRFANNSVTVVKSLRNMWSLIYIGKEKRRIVGASTNPEPRSLKRFVSELVKSGAESRPSAEYTSLPKGPFTYSPTIFDERLHEAGDLVGFVQDAVEAAVKAGAKRASGIVTQEVNELAILTSGGVEGTDLNGKITLNIRAFANGEASGQGLSCAARLSDFKPAEAGRVAGEYARQSIGSKPAEPGEYDVVFTPTVTGNLFSVLARRASAFNVEAGLSFLEGMVGNTIGYEELTFSDHGAIEGGLGNRIFDDEGFPTRSNRIIEKGMLMGYLHNSTTAKKFNVENTGNAGIIAPFPWNLEVSPGEYSLDEMIKEVKKGLLLTNNWYTRFQNYRTGEYSTVLRDASLYIEDGRVKGPVIGMRMSDSMPRQLKSITAISKERQWISWWETKIGGRELPVLAPCMLVKGVTMTRPFE